MKSYLNNPLQYRQEIEEFVQLMKDNNIKSYLEIGSMYGGSLWLVSRIMPKGSRIVSVDLPTPGKPHAAQSLQECMQHLRRENFDVHLFAGDSTNQDNVTKVRALGPFDACLIDGNHTMQYVTKDWENYGPMCKLVAFHDINYSRPADQITAHMRQHQSFYAIDVPPFWNKLKESYRHIEIKRDKRDNGLCVLWR
jgi:predicted O-methyltransferase YrrM